MKTLYKILSVALVGIAATSCEDEIVQNYSVDKPVSVENAEYLNSFDKLKDCVNPGFQLCAAVSGSTFSNNGSDFILAKNNFNEVFPSSGWNFSECVGPDGNFDFGGVSSFVNKAQSAELDVFGAPFCWSAGQANDYLASLIKNKTDQNAKSNYVLKFTQAAAKSNPWDSNFSLTWEEALELETEYIISFKAKASKAVGLQLELMDPSGDKCTKFGSDDEKMVNNSNSWEASYSSHSDVPQYGVNVETDWTTITLTMKTKKEACDGYQFKYTKFQFGTGKLEGDLFIDDMQIYKKDDPDKKNYVANSTFDDEDVTMYSAGVRDEIAAVTKVETATEYTDEVRCLKIECPAKKEQTWETQLWINSSIPFKSGVSYKFKCKVRADEAFTPGSGIHGDPDGDHWIAGGVTDVKITTEWQDYVKEGTFEKDYVHEATGTDGHSFAFDLSIDKPNVIYFDDISLEIGGTEVIKNGSFDSDDLSSFVVKIDQDFNRAEIFDGTITYTVITVEEMGGIPLTIDEKRENLLPSLEKWIGGLFNSTKGYVKSWNIVSEPLAEKRDDKSGEELNISGNAFTLQSKSAHVENKNDKDVKKNFYWGEHLGKNYVRDLVKLAREAGAANGVADLKLFVNESRLESNEEKLQSLLDWITYWEEDGTQIDGIGTEMHVSFFADAELQKAAEDGIVSMFNKLKDSGKLIRISELDMNYISLAGAPVKATNMTDDMNKQMSDFYKFIVKNYLEIIPAEQQAGICLWTPVDATGNAVWRVGEPAGLWSSGYQRKAQYAGFAEGLQGK